MPQLQRRPPKKGSAKAKAQREAKTKQQEQEQKEQKTGEEPLETLFDGSVSTAGAAESKAEEDSGRTATGLLATDARSRDVKINSFSLSLHGRVLVEDTTIELNCGQRYGLIGRNGCGKVG
jgi:ATP-binding cassette subfamily F protein 2